MTRLIEIVAIAFGTAVAVLACLALLVLLNVPPPKAPPGFVDVRDFGAIIDGKTNDRFAIEAAVDFAIAHNKPGVYLPPGLYGWGSKP